MKTLIENRKRSSAKTRTLCALVLGLLWLSATCGAQTFTTLKSFGSLTGGPRSQLVQGPDGTLYGTTSDGEGLVRGTVFKVQPDGDGFTVLKWFTNSVEGSAPFAGVTLANGVLYGTTWSGGSLNFGTVFKLNTDGTGFTVLRHLGGLPDYGGKPRAALTLSNSVLYGTESRGIFRLNTDGSGYSVLKQLVALGDGPSPASEAGLTLSGGVIFATARDGGRLGRGSVFQVNTDGTGFAVLKEFGGSDGEYPAAGLTLSGSVLYGTTYWGGGSNVGTVFKVNTDGTDYLVLKEFGGSDGAYPEADLALSGGILYGTTTEGGGSGAGTVFKINTDGSGYGVLKEFNFTDGAYPRAGLTLSGGVIYGTTEQGGDDAGTVFKLGLSAHIPLTARWLNDAIILSWSNPDFALQAAPAVTGTYFNVSGATSPYTNSISEFQKFFRLVKR